jgi:hypothetical protein
VAQPKQSLNAVLVDLPIVAAASRNLLKSAVKTD